MGAIRREGTTHRLDYTTPVRTGLTTGLVSTGTKLKAAAKLSRVVARYRNDLGYDSYETLAELDTETVRDYCRREINEEFLQYCGGAGEATESFDVCVIASTAQPALAMYPQMDDNARAFYEMVTYRRLGSVAIGLSQRPPGDRETYTLGVLKEDPDLIAVMADHNKTAGRAPEGKGLLTVSGRDAAARIRTAHPASGAAMAAPRASTQPA